MSPKHMSQNQTPVDKISTKESRAANIKAGKRKQRPGGKRFKASPSK